MTWKKYKLATTHSFVQNHVVWQNQANVNSNKNFEVKMNIFQIVSYSCPVWNLTCRSSEASFLNALFQSVWIQIWNKDAGWGEKKNDLLRKYRNWELLYWFWTKIIFNHNTRKPTSSYMELLRRKKKTYLKLSLTT